MWSVICLLPFLAYASAIVCPPNACATVRCPYVTAASCKGIVSSGWCGCCNTCLKELMEGDLCMDQFLLGVPPTSQCTTGTHCDIHTHRCIRDKVTAKKSLHLCEIKRKQVNDKLLAAQKQGRPLLGLQVPRCDSNGDYEGKQFSGSQAYCVTKNGTAISGYMVNRWEAGNMTCDCARDQYAYMKTGLIGRLFFCAPNGNYRSRQTNRAVTGPCAAELASVNVRLFAAQQSGHPLLGLERPHCDSDGNYAGMQYAGSEAYCVTKNGTAISGYMVNRWEAKNMNCQCARDQYDYMQTGLIGKMFSCEPNGNYKKIQCLGSVCYCADMQGKQVGTSTVSIGSMNSLNC